MTEHFWYILDNGLKMIQNAFPKCSEKLGFEYFGLLLWLSWQRIRLQCGRPGFDLWVGKIPGRREQLPTPVFWPGEFHGLYSPWGRKESDTTERLSLMCCAAWGILVPRPGMEPGPWQGKPNANHWETREFREKFFFSL